VWLEVLSGEDAGRVVEVTGGGQRPFVLGRVQGSDLVIRDARASRRHVALTPGPDGVQLEDLGSANGTLLDGTPVREATLRGGETLEIGGVRIAVLRAPPPETGTATPAEPADDAASRAPLGRIRTWHPGSRAAPVLIAAAGVAAGAALVLLVTSLGGGGEDERAPDVVKAVAPATAMVLARRDGAPSGRGSGWVLEPGLVVTAAHVINQGASFFAGSGSQLRRASVLAAAPCEDLAVLQAPGWQGRARLSLGDAGDVEQGETVLAFGFPAGSSPGEDASSTRGVVSAADTFFRDPAPDVPFYPEAIRTDTALDPGFSGGPLVDLDRNVIGVNAAARSTGDDGRPLQGANYAIAADRARRVLDDLVRGRSRAWIGADFGYPTPEELAARQLPEGLFLLGAVAGSPAALAGLGGKGELLEAVDGHPVGRTLSGWCAATRGIRSGQRARLTVREPDGRVRVVSLRFG
jgi:S1-C subfamily serine protease